MQNTMVNVSDLSKHQKLTFNVSGFKSKVQLPVTLFLEVSMSLIVHLAI